MKQQTLAMAGDQNAQYEQYRRPTKRDTFLATMEQIVPCAELCERHRAALPEAGQRAPSGGTGTDAADVLRAALVQPGRRGLRGRAARQPALRRFVGIDLGRERVPDATTLLKFRRLLEKHKLGEALFAKVGEVLHGPAVMKVGTGTIVDATIIGAPSSTKNAGKGSATPRCTRPARASSGSSA